MASLRRPLLHSATVTGVPDENLVAVVATVVSFGIILPLLVKWWPKQLPRTGKKKPARAKKIVQPARPVRRAARPTAATPRAMAASGRPRRPS
jgi:hypothetical protein